MCDRLGVFVQVVPEGVELIPPSQNVKKFGHNPELLESKKYLDYLFEMNDSDFLEEELGALESLKNSSLEEDFNSKDHPFHSNDYGDAWA